MRFVALLSPKPGPEVGCGRGGDVKYPFLVTALSWVIVADLSPAIPKAL